MPRYYSGENEPIDALCHKCKTMFRIKPSDLHALKDEYKFCSDCVPLIREKKEEKNVMREL